MRATVVEKAGSMVLAGFLATVGAAAAAAAEKPTPTPRPAGGQSLNEVAKNKKLKGDTDGSTGGSIVITNENLSDYASKGGLTTAKPNIQNTSNPVHAGPNVQQIDAETAAENEHRNLWQQKYMRQLETIASIERQINDLDYKIPGLWNDFFARDDPMYRDGVIKPTLDRALARRDELAKRLAEERPKLEQIKEDARRAGAEPGWFRGIEQPSSKPADADTRPDGAMNLTDRKPPN
jgi:hypothetical protein